MSLDTCDMVHQWHSTGTGTGPCNWYQLGSTNRAQILGPYCGCTNCGCTVRTNGLLGQGFGFEITSPHFEGGGQDGRNYTRLCLQPW